MNVDLKVMDKVGNRRGRPATAKLEGSETGLQLRRLREKNDGRRCVYAELLVARPFVADGQGGHRLHFTQAGFYEGSVSGSR